MSSKYSTSQTSLSHRYVRKREREKRTQQPHSDVGRESPEYEEDTVVDFEEVGGAVVSISAASLIRYDKFINNYAPYELQKHKFA